MTEISLLGINIKKLNKQEILFLISNFLSGETAGYVTIVTLNPEILLLANSNKAYANIINSADLKVIDGFGIKLLGLIKNMQVGERIAGADLAFWILEKSKKMNLKILFVLRKEGMTTKEDMHHAAKRMGLRKYEVIYANENLKPFKNYEVLLVGLGAPDQENFIFENKKNFTDLKLAIGIGGTFDFWTAKKKRAPLFLRKIGLEWLWRLIIQPNRMKRILKATVVFLWKGIFNYKKI